MARRSAARARSPADAHRAEPVLLLQPEHAPARRSARALRRRPGAARAGRQPAARDRPAARSCSPRSTGRSAPTAATASAPRTTTATRSTSTRWRWPSRASRTTTRRPRGSRTPCRGSGPRRGCSPTTAAACRTSETTTAGRCCRLPAARWTICATASRSPPRSSSAPSCSRPGTRRSGVDARRIRIRNPQSPIRNRSAIAQSAIRNGCVGGAARHRLLRVALRRRRPHRHRRRAARLPERRPRARRRAVADAVRRRRPAADRSGHRLLHDRSRAARPPAVHGAAQHADARRSAAVDAERPVPLVARREQPRPCAGGPTSGSTSSTARTTATARRAPPPRPRAARRPGRRRRSRRRRRRAHAPPCTGTSIPAGRSSCMAGARCSRARIARPSVSASSCRRGCSNNSSADAETGLGWHSPVYGRIEPTTDPSRQPVGPPRRSGWSASSISIRTTRSSMSTCVPVWAEAGRRRTAAIRIARATSVDHVLFAEPAAYASRRACGIAGHSASAVTASRSNAGSGASAKSKPTRGCSSVGRPRHSSIAVAALVDGSMMRVVRPPRFSARTPPPRGHVFADFGDVNSDAGSGDQRSRTSREWGSDMCGIAGFVESSTATAPFGARRRPRARAPHVRRHPPPRPRRRGRLVDDGRRARHAPPEHHRPLDRPPADPQRGPHRSGSSSTARSTTSASCGASSRRPGTASTRPPTPKSSSTPTSSGARTRSRGCAACSASRSGTRARARCWSRAIASASSRCTTPRSTGGCYFGSELKSLLEAPDLPRDLDPDALDHYLSFLYTPRDGSIFKQRAEAAAGTSAHVAGRTHRRSSSIWELPADETFTGSEADAVEPAARRA